MEVQGITIQGPDDAQAWWTGVSPDTQQLIIGTTWCVNCQKSVTMHDVHGEVVEDSGNVVRHSFLLKGMCCQGRRTYGSCTLLMM